MKLNHEKTGYKEKLRNKAAFGSITPREVNKILWSSRVW
jgi:hypothetical protein